MLWAYLSYYCNSILFGRQSCDTYIRLEATNWTDLYYPPPSVCYWETTKRYVMSQQGSLTPGHDLCLSQTTVTWWLYELVIQMCMYRVWLYMCTSPSLLSERQVIRSTGITSHHSLCQKLYDRLSWPRRMTIK